MVASALITALLATAAAATPLAERADIGRVKLTKRINTDALKDFVAKDKARAQHLAQSRKLGSRALESRQTNQDVTNTAVVYTAATIVGNQTFDLIIDTGSSNTWVGAGTKYVKSSTGTSTGKSFSVTYGSGSVRGTEYTDQVTLGTLVITNQSVGVASSASGFSGYDGILGIGPVDLTEGTVSGSTTVPTVTDNLYSQGKIPSEVIGISFEPTTVEETTNGELTWGGTDSTKYTGSITYTSLTTTYPADYYWGINQQVTYNGTSYLNSAGIVDTGTTLVYLATDAYNKYKTATGATLDSTTGLLKVTATQYAALQPLNFVIGGTTFALSANAQLWPRSLNTYIGGSSSSYYLVVNDLGSNSGEGLDFINGYTFLERFYTVFDTTSQRFGIAQTSYTNATTN